jgi:hypothetical protein
MASVFTVFRRLALPLNQAATFLTQSFTSKKEAEERVNELNTSWRQLMQCKLVDVSTGQPQDTGLTLGSVLADLGVGGLAHFAGEQKVIDGPELVLPESRIIIPGGTRH